MTEVKPNAWYPCRRISGINVHPRYRYLRLTDQGFEGTAGAIEWFIESGILTKDEEGALVGGWGTEYFICAGYKTHGKDRRHLQLIKGGADHD